jgi:hypothetical protein
LAFISIFARSLRKEHAITRHEPYMTGDTVSNDERFYHRFHTDGMLQTSVVITNGIPSTRMA